MLSRSLTPCAKSTLESLQGLDWLNFFLAALLTGFGPFVALSLAERGWTSADIGLMLTIGGLASLLAQVPGGELIDMVQSKRALLGASIAALTLALLLLAVSADKPAL